MLRRVVRGVVGSVAMCASIAALGAGGCGGNLASDAPDGSSGPGPGGSGTGPGAGADAGQTGANRPRVAGVDGGMVQSPSMPPSIVHKVDILFDIDNSASMADKQAYLSQAIPDLVRRLVSPNCIDTAGNATGETASPNGSCVMGTAEFAPVQDMHIGIVTSSLGPRLGDVCPATGANSTQRLANGGAVDRHNDDQGHLINRGSDPSNQTDYTETPVSDTGTANFLDWYPSSNKSAAPNVGATPLGDSSRVISDFESMIIGAHAFGCGIESQLESWYRFLVQPDPYASLTTSDVNGVLQAQWQGFDTVLLAQRANFLRPDSLVAVVVLSDEDDSEVDVRSFAGTAWNFMSASFHPPRGTEICLTNPNDPGCTSCAFGGHANDSSCMKGDYTDIHDWGFDPNLRHVHQKQKYGVSVQFPIQRYVLGLTSPKVPNRSGEYPAAATEYQGLSASNLNCSNPLFAAKLPAPPANVDPSHWNPTAEELCNLAPGNRSPGSIYYSHIGGVPHQLLQVDPQNPNSPQKAMLSAADWKLILGADPLNYDYTGIDPHMVESYQSRINIPVPENVFRVLDSNATEGADPISGREWVTDSTMAEHQGLLVDLEYACIFKLATPRQCDAAPISADPTLAASCECQPPMPGTGAFTHAQVPAVCNDVVPTQQDYAKVYPTTRELLLAKLLGEVQGANEGVISSMCPIHTVEQGAGDPLFGYRPAMSALIGRLKKSL